eukprot:CAMPEP_0204061528 /NCGR_PEP_ID=MMETSP0360-20130528/142282_1 /ASSEMBLY_ACC=CAM_ASM_000342 /TAXON_ID=268821 /ORGANISM="Scrippsiella Hangoei, Strain SHTV-5" /LENGTH=53 /DNA_ID=CAMNT_0051009273 /DNA_START=112 /DNA_END=269 /DNA_ORIENTATION=+
MDAPTPAKDSAIPNCKALLMAESAPKASTKAVAFKMVITKEPARTSTSWGAVV